MQHLYISYPSDDYEFAHRLVDDLQAAGYPVFVDAVSETGTMAWAAETRQAIRSAGAVLMILWPDRGRRLGIRHEGVGARRRGKPTYVLRRSPGDLPRYLADAPQIDFSGDYDPALRDLLAALPPASVLIESAPLPTPRRAIRPPRQPEDQAARRRVTWLVMLLVLLAILALGIAFGVIPV
ncbi:MAG: toll/interleukin-1 receptor domain-containing protein [Chloroflexi bacterium]|jgi:hypothetical protein|nr:toll/interleukin-1 receptor domain-containing protein [Chloroflexota bacterium]